MIVNDSSQCYIITLNDMDIQTYRTARASLLTRYYQAARAHCPRTADARLRDLAKLDSQHDGRDYETVLNELTERFKDEQSI